jgi:hypothetical protein
LSSFNDDCLSSNEDLGGSIPLDVLQDQGLATSCRAFFVSMGRHPDCLDFLVLTELSGGFIKNSLEDSRKYGGELGDL